MHSPSTIAFNYTRLDAINERIQYGPPFVNARSFIDDTLRVSNAHQ